MAQAGADWCWSVATAPGCGCTSAQACQLKTVHAQDHPGVRLLESFAVQLKADGEADGHPVRLEGRRGDRLRVGLTPLGRARICTEFNAGTPAVGRYTAC
jgi:type IV fimbrial biogenesis protein FimT